MQQHLKSKLPDYMIPALFSRLETIPLTPNGKIDRKRLAQTRPVRPERTAVGAPTSEIEKRVAAIWRSVLGNDDIDIDNGFFESGGDSILAVTVAARIRDSFACEFDVTRLFEHATVRAISRYIAATASNAAAEAPYAAPQWHAARSATIAPDQADGSGYPDYYDTSVAIVGISCHFPGAQDHRQFWDNLISGREGVEMLSADELRRLGVPEQIIGHPRYVPVRSTIAGKDLFDPAFFKISPGMRR